MSAVAEEPRNLAPLIEDGVTYIVDMDTGEVVEAKVEGFKVDSTETAEWVMAKIQKAEAEILALSQREKALLENLRTMRSRAEQKVTGLRFRFENELAEFARQNLEKGKKSWVCPYGKVAFRTSPERLKVANPELALVWAKEFSPGAVKVTEEFRASQLGMNADGKPWREVLPTLSPESQALAGFVTEPATETVAIDTGI